jgi:hypothetical protein
MLVQGVPPWLLWFTVPKLTCANPGPRGAIPLGEKFSTENTEFDSGWAEQ